MIFLILPLAAFASNIQLFEHEFRTATDEKYLSKEAFRPLSGALPISVEYSGYIEYKAKFLYKKNQMQDLMGINFGVIGYADKAFLNGAKIGETGSFPPDKLRYSFVQRVYSLPERLIVSEGENTVSVIVELPL